MGKPWENGGLPSGKLSHHEVERSTMLSSWVNPRNFYGPRLIPVLLLVNALQEMVTWGYLLDLTKFPRKCPQLINPHWLIHKAWKTPEFLFGKKPQRYPMISLWKLHEFSPALQALAVLVALHLQVADELWKFRLLVAVARLKTARPMGVPTSDKSMASSNRDFMKTHRKIEI